MPALGKIIESNTRIQLRRNSWTLIREVGGGTKIITRQGKQKRERHNKLMVLVFMLHAAVL